MSSPTPDREVLEDLWQKRLNDAKLRLDFARNFLKGVSQDFPLKEVTNSRGHFEYQQGLRAENAALTEYSRLLRIFGDLTLRGIIPDESEWLKTRAAKASGSETKSE